MGSSQKHGVLAFADFPLLASQLSFSSLPFLHSLFFAVPLEISFPNKIQASSFLKRKRWQIAVVTAIGLGG